MLHHPACTYLACFINLACSITRCCSVSEEPWKKLQEALLFPRKRTSSRPWDERAFLSTFQKSRQVIGEVWLFMLLHAEVQNAEATRINHEMAQAQEDQTQRVFQVYNEPGSFGGLSSRSARALQKTGHAPVSAHRLRLLFAKSLTLKALKVELVGQNHTASK